MSAITDKIKGNWNQVKGKVKEEYGEAVGDSISYEEGKEDQVIGQLQKALGKTKEELKDWVDKI